MSSEKPDPKLSFTDKPPYPWQTSQGLVAILCILVAGVFLVVISNLYILTEPDWGSKNVILTALFTVLIGFFFIWVVWMANRIFFHAFEDYIEIHQAEQRARIKKEDIRGISVTETPAWEIVGKRGKDGADNHMAFIASRKNHGLVIETGDKNFVISSPDPASTATELRALFNL